MVANNLPVEDAINVMGRVLAPVREHTPGTVHARLKADNCRCSVGVVSDFVPSQTARRKLPGCQGWVCSFLLGKRAAV